MFTLFSAADIRRTRDNHLENLETLILAITSRLFALRNHPAFPDPEAAPDREALNCIRILTRLIPFIYESEPLEAWEDKFFWGTRRKRSTRRSPNADETSPEAIVPEEYEDAPPLMEELVDCLVDLLFYQGFTLPPAASPGKSKVTYAIWLRCGYPLALTAPFFFLFSFF